MNTVELIIVILDCSEINIKVSDTGIETIKPNNYKGVL